jgi:hypothetical protein
MKIKNSALIIAIIFTILVGCEVKDNNKETNTNIENKAEENVEVGDKFRPNWWGRLDEKKYIASYGFGDNSDKLKAKEIAVNKAQKKIKHFSKTYTINLVHQIQEESNSGDYFKNLNMNRVTRLIYNRDYSRYLKVLEQANSESDAKIPRVYVAIGFPTKELHKTLVEKLNKAPYVAKMRNSKTFLKLIKEVGVTINNSTDIQEQASATSNKIKIPSWYKISHNNKKVMINKTAVASSEQLAYDEAVNNCKSSVYIAANNYARAEVEHFRKLSGYQLEEFAKVKKAVKKQLNNVKIKSTFERKQIITGDDGKIYALVQYSIDKNIIKKAILKVLKSDTTLNERVKSSKKYKEYEAL